MNAWLIAAAVLTVTAFVPCVVAASRGDTLSRLVGLELAGTVTVIVLLLLAQGYHRSSYQDVGLVLAPLSFAGSLVFARFLERWL